MPTLGVPELIIILVIVLIVFGAGKLADIGGALGKGIKEFRKATKDAEEATKEVEESLKESTEAKPAEEK
jgi:sec-independent protein translocase protein TatA